MKPIIFPLSGIRKEAASTASWLKLYDVAAGAAKKSLMRMPITSAAVGGIGAIGSGIGADYALDNYERKRQQTDPGYKVSDRKRLGYVLGSAAGGGLIGSTLGFLGSKNIENKIYNKVHERVKAIKRLHTGD